MRMSGERENQQTLANYIDNNISSKKLEKKLINYGVKQKNVAGIWNSKNHTRSQYHS